jgi:hypothetical protein
MRIADNPIDRILSLYFNTRYSVQYAPKETKGSFA